MTLPAALEAIVARHDPSRVVEVLSSYLTEARRARIDEVLSARIDGVAVAVEAPSDPHNAAAVVRTAEALGALHVHVIAAERRALHARAVTQGAYHWVQTEEHADLAAFVAQMRAQGRQLWGAAMDGSVPLGRIPTDAPMCLLFGNETRGLSAAAREACDGIFHVPMTGMSESLNLSVTAAISLHDVLGRRRQHGRRGDLSGRRLEAMRARYYAHSVDPRLLAGLLGREDDA
jgi:tRNA (guanosine-2'-O-)-methyltransferase